MIESYGENALQDVEIGQKMIHWLEHYYPNHAFFVEVKSETGWASIQLLYIDGNKATKKWTWGMGIHLASIMNEEDLRKRMMRDGGELLERWGLARKGANLHTHLDAISHGMNIEGGMM